MYNKTTMFALMTLLLISSPIMMPHTVAAESHEHGQENHGHAPQATRPDNSNGLYQIKFKTHPKPENIIPDKDMVEMNFSVNHEGQSAENVTLSYRVYTPKETFWFGTDFPMVEGTQLLSGSVPVPTGSQTISMVLPIRGNYHVKATARGPEGVTETHFDFSVPENPREMVNLGIFLLVLLGLGGIGGFIISRTSPGLTTQSWLIGLALAGSLFNLAQPNAALAHGDGSWDPHTLDQEKGIHTLRENIHLETKLFPQPVNVGEMLNVRYHAEIHGEDSHGHGTDEHNHENHSVSGRIMAESHFVHTEGGLEMGNQTSWLTDGRGEINVQLFDGAPHYLVTRFYRATDIYKPSGHDHARGEKSQSEQNYEDHESGAQPAIEPAWEAETGYDLEAGSYTVRFHESGDPSMTWLLLPGNTDELRKTALHTMDQCTTVKAGGTIPGDDSCYKLSLNSSGTTFTLKIEQDGHYRLFTQHLPREFDMTLESDDGNVAQPERKFITGKGEFLGRTVKWVELNAIQPPFDDIFKSMITLLAILGLGVFVGFKAPGWMR